MITFGWINIYAAEFDESHQSILDLNQRYGKQFIWMIAAILLALTILIIDSKFFSTFSYLFFAVSILSLIAVLAVGTTIAGSRSWFQIGEFSIQPAEFAKFAAALALAKYLSTINSPNLSLKHLFKASVIIFMPAVLILLQHDTGSALVYIAFLLVLFREGLSGKVLVFGLGAVILFILTLDRKSVV